MNSFTGESRSQADQKCLVLVLVAFALLGIVTPCRAKEPTPNIILCMADDLGWGDTGFNGHQTIKTPHLDSMARNGLVFQRFYAAAPVCSPTRGSCLTGRHPYRYGITFANTGHLRAEEVCLAEILAKNGYATGHFGKWHLGTLTTKVKDSNRGRPGATTDYAPPWENGFQVCFSTEAKVPTWWEPGDYQRFGTRYWTGPDQPAAPEQIQGDDSRVIMDEALDFVDQAAKADKPFFAVIWFHAPHLPVVGGPEYLALYPQEPENKQHFYACVTALDEQMGRLRAKLRELGVAQDTMLWFCSDNGPEGNPKPRHRAQGSSGPFRGRKRSLYEGGIRVPAVLEWPRAISQAQTTDFPAVTSDYFPTVLDVLGDKPAKTPIDGISLLPMIRGESTQRAMPIGFRSASQSALSDDRYKLIHNRHKKRPRSDNGNAPVAEWELYDLLDDPSETKNLASARPEVVDRMSEALLKWQASCDQTRHRPTKAP